MCKYIFGISFYLNLTLMSFNVLAITPTFNLVQEINFGKLTLSTGSCRMLPADGRIIAFEGTFLCDLPSEGRQVGKYTIIANPNKQVQVRFKRILDDDNGYRFNPRMHLISDVSQKVIFDTTEYVQINSGDSGIINIDVGGDLTVYELIPPGQTINFVFDDAIAWNELP
ncbi:hypothetical protein [Paraglaciecola sp. L3A3]|uniref:hypothetical protein n=1 Tax=Paraglaciecola sp. L3A3 TaxID=2686358 RepID=UPI00131B4C54|nr:hypothetical protein [Paraglaciecola sp. L3A3]